MMDYVGKYEQRHGMKVLRPEMATGNATDSLTLYAYRYDENEKIKK